MRIWGIKRSWRREKKVTRFFPLIAHFFLNGPLILSVDYTEMTFISFFVFFFFLNSVWSVRCICGSGLLHSPDCRIDRIKRMSTARSEIVFLMSVNNTSQHVSTLSNSDSSTLIACLLLCARLLMCAVWYCPPLLLCEPGVPHRTLACKVNLLFCKNAKEISMFKWHRDGGEDTVFLSLSLCMRIHSLTVHLR